MASEKTWIPELLEAQNSLKDTVLDQISDINIALREEKSATVRNQLKLKRDALVDQFRDLQSESIAIIAAQTVNDIAIINQVSEDVKQFVYKVKKISKTIKVVTAFIVFVAACMAKDPKTIADAAAALYKVMNETIDDEGQKGDKAAVIMKPLQIPKIVAQAAKAKAKLAPKIAPKPGPTKKPAVKPASRKTK